MTRLLSYAPWLALGPVTGPLAAWAVHEALRRRYARAGLAVGLIGAFWTLGPAFVAVVGAYAVHRGWLP